MRTIADQLMPSADLLIPNGTCINFEVDYFARAQALAITAIAIWLTLLFIIKLWRAIARIGERRERLDKEVQELDSRLYRLEHAKRGKP